jgi:2-polyprenyl-3-methyl-5-hydroxy-6-metoxy-1,4-benzoquinol methylase
MDGQQQQGGGETKKRKWQPPAFIQKLIPMPITEDGYHPNKRFYRSRAHCNPLSHNDCYEYPSHPDEMDWTCMYPSSENPVVRLLDVGCGFGGLTSEYAGGGSPCCAHPLMILSSGYLWSWT